MASTRKRFNPGVSEPPLFVAARSAFHGSPRPLDSADPHFPTFFAHWDGRFLGSRGGFHPVYFMQESRNGEGPPRRNGAPPRLSRIHPVSFSRLGVARSSGGREVPSGSGPGPWPGTTPPGSRPGGGGAGGLRRLYNQAYAPSLAFCGAHVPAVNQGNREAPPAHSIRRPSCPVSLGSTDRSPVRYWGETEALQAHLLRRPPPRLSRARSLTDSRGSSFPFNFAPPAQHSTKRF